jgi:hypothetical protein
MKSQLTLRMPGQVPASLHIHLLGICLTLISACSVFKEKSFFETDSLQRQNRKATLRQESVSQTKLIQFSSSKDSLDRQSFAEIIPKGTFSYSPAQGFSGEAEKVLIRERLKASHRGTGTSKLVQSNKVREAIKKNENSRVQIRQKKKELRSPGLSWVYLAGCGLIFWLIWRFRRKW